MSIKKKILKSIFNCHVSDCFEYPQIKSLHEVSFLLPQIVMGGVEKVLLAYLTEIRKNTSWDICVYSLQPVTDHFFIKFFRDNCIKLKDGYLPAKPKKFFQTIKYKILTPIYRLIAFLSLRKQLAKSDILIDFKSFCYAKIIKDLRVPKIVWLHGSINHFNQHSGRFIKNMQYYDKLVCLSDSFMEDFKEQYPDYADKILRIYNPIDADEVRSKATGENKYGKYFAIVSRLDTEKDHETAISAFKIFAKERSEAKLLIAGDGILQDKLTRMASNCPQIRFLGKIDEPYSLIKHSIAHILSSYNEGFAVVLLENAALGVLSVSSRCKSGPPEILLNGKAGILFNPGDKQELLQIMRDIWSGRIKNANEMIITASNELSRFNAKNNAAQVIKLIQEVYDKNFKIQKGRYN